MTTNKTTEEGAKEAQNVFDTLSHYAMKHINDIPETVIEATDCVLNYVGDIAMKRKYTPDKPTEAFPSLYRAFLEERIGMVGEKTKLTD